MSSYKKPFFLLLLESLETELTDPEDENYVNDRKYGHCYQLEFDHCFIN